MKKAEFGFRHIIIMSVLLLGLLFVGCGDPNREDCKQACQKMYDCDNTTTGECPGTSTLDLNWLNGCKNSCAEADHINATATQCILSASCCSIAEECGI